MHSYRTKCPNPKSISSFCNCYTNNTDSAHISSARKNITSYPYWKATSQRATNANAIRFCRLIDSFQNRDFVVFSSLLVICLLFSAAQFVSSNAGFNLRYFSIIFLWGTFFSLFFSNYLMRTIELKLRLSVEIIRICTIHHHQRLTNHEQTNSQFGIQKLLCARVWVYEFDVWRLYGIEIEVLYSPFLCMFGTIWRRTGANLMVV